MTNLIVTLLSIALVAVAAIMATYYGGEYLNIATPQARANILLNEIHQIHSAATLYGQDNGVNTFGVDFNMNTISQSPYIPTRIPILGRPPPTPFSYIDQRCNQSIDNQSVRFSRGICQINGVNVVNLYMTDIPTGSGSCNVFNAFASDASSANLPIVEIAKAINEKMGLPAGLSYAASGLPYAADGSTGYCQVTSSMINTYAGQYMTGSNKFNYCYLAGTSGNVEEIICTFTY